MRAAVKKCPVESSSGPPPDSLSVYGRRPALSRPAVEWAAALPDALLLRATKVHGSSAPTSAGRHRSPRRRRSDDFEAHNFLDGRLVRSVILGGRRAGCEASGSERAGTPRDRCNELGDDPG